MNLPSWPSSGTWQSLVYSVLNGSNPHCEDPMSPFNTEYTRDCQVPKEGHDGRFIANFCVKMIGETENKEKLVVRTCVLNDLNSQCGGFTFQNISMAGCVLTCDTDGCNAGHKIISYTGLINTLFVLIGRKSGLA